MRVKHLPAGDQPRHFRTRLGEANTIDGGKFSPVALRVLFLAPLQHFRD